MDELSFYDGAYTGQEIDNAIGKVRNPDTTPTESSSSLITSGGVKIALTNTNSAIGIVQDESYATQNISAGQYVIWKGSLYTADSAISSGGALSGNLTAVSGGGLNDLLSTLSIVRTYQLRYGNTMTLTFSSSFRGLLISTSTASYNNGFVAAFGRGAAKRDLTVLHNAGNLSATNDGDVVTISNNSTAYDSWISIICFWGNFPAVSIS